MDFINIMHNLGSLSNEQERDFRIVESLLNNLNSLKPSHVPDNKLNYGNHKFTVVSFGYAHRFLLEDIEKALTENIDLHKEFIIEEVENSLRITAQTKTQLLLLIPKLF